MKPPGEANDATISKEVFFPLNFLNSWIFFTWRVQEEIGPPKKVNKGASSNSEKHFRCKFDVVEWRCLKCGVFTTGIFDIFRPSWRVKVWPGNQPNLAKGAPPTDDGNQYHLLHSPSIGPQSFVLLDTPHTPDSNQRAGTLQKRGLTLFVFCLGSGMDLQENHYRSRLIFFTFFTWKGTGPQTERIVFHHFSGDMSVFGGVKFWIWKNIPFKHLQTNSKHRTCQGCGLSPTNDLHSWGSVRLKI